MIIYINWNHLAIVNQNKKFIHDVINRVLIAYVDGTHYVVIEPESTKILIDSGLFSGESNARLQSIGSKYGTRGGVLENKHASILEVMPDLEAPLECDEKNKYRIGLRALLSSKYLDQPILLVEGKEGRIYELMMEEVRKKNNIGKLVYEIDIGGGDTTAANFTSRVDRRRVVVCLGDTDKLTPTGRFGQTLLAILDEAKKIEKFIGRVCETPGREVENFIPYEILKRIPLAKGGADRLKIIDRLFERQGGGIVDDCIWLYYDLKTKIEHARILDYANDSRSIEWVLRKYHLSDVREINEFNWPVWGGGIVENLMKNNSLVKEFCQFVRNDKYFEYHFYHWFCGFIFYFAGEPSNRT
ncbi:hypothetical protein GCM10011497_06900 [Elstera cyanobacteriorum]|uniref:hypothetical protein n=1 Tax=Elstera cyanobacteriorum TaxID=2022747 RepID=UPI00114073DC|nr:hypothetical protein [Elstera cyanobacteriorum]GFZ80980.1 hypothetical protein GCM10011497_06900 [Elstera cyanobacteriorum]